MKHLLVLESQNAEKEIKKALESKENIYNPTLVKEREGEEGDQVRSFMSDISSLPIRVGHQVTIVSGDRSIVEEHLAISVLQKRLSDTIKVIVVRAEGVRAVIPWEDRPLLPKSKRDSIYASTNFKPEGGCSGDCSSCH